MFYKPNNFQTFRFTYGKAFNTPTAINLATDLFIGKRGFVDYYLRGNTDGTDKPIPAEYTWAIVEASEWSKNNFTMKMSK